MQDKKWFRAKKYGWGWYPVSWQGWTITIVYLVVIVSLFHSVDKYSHSGSDTLIAFALPFIGLTSLLLSICYVKGEKPGWHFGDYDWPEADKILKEIKKSKSILLHCHPSPDPDSVGSSLAMKFAIEQLGKKVTVIQGDSEFPQAFKHFPGADEIIKKRFSEVNLDEFDLFIILDSGTPSMVSRKEVPVFPLKIKTVVIDHHSTNIGYADFNLIDPDSPAVAYIIYKMFKTWNIKISPEIAINLFMGMYTDTGGFKYPPCDDKVLEAAAELAKIYPDYTKSLSMMENSHEKDSVYAQALALNSIKTFCNDKLAIAAVSNEELLAKGIHPDSVSEGYIASILKSVIGWEISVCMTEVEVGKIKMSFRTRDPSLYDVSKLAAAIGGGGHKAAAGAILSMPLRDVIEKVVDTAKKIYNI